MAMIDTGAASSVLRPEIISSIGLKPTGTVKNNTPSCKGFDCYQSQAAILFLNNVAVENSELIEAPRQGQHIQCLIGRDILRHALFIYYGYTESITLSFW